MDEKKKIVKLDAQELLKYQPNRYPFLLIDRVTEVVPGKSAKGYKNMTNNEWYFPVHFPGNPNMPGCLQIEAMAQMVTIAITSMEGMEGRVVHSYKHSAVFHKEIVPGDRLDLESVLLSFRRGLGKGRVKGYTDGELACELDTVVLVPDIFSQYKPENRQKTGSGCSVNMNG